MAVEWQNSSRVVVEWQNLEKNYSRLVEWQNEKYNARRMKSKMVVEW